MRDREGRERGRGEREGGRGERQGGESDKRVREREKLRGSSLVRVEHKELFLVTTTATQVIPKSLAADNKMAF